jgi:MFS family permease
MGILPSGVKDRRVKRSLRYSTYEGISANSMAGFGNSYISPFAIALKASNEQIGLLSSVPSLMSSISQFKAPDLADRLGSRKRMFYLAVLFEATLWLPIVLLTILPLPGKSILLVVFFTIMALLGSFGAPASGSMISSLVPEEKRGRYFGWRGKVFGVVAVVCTFVAGFLLQVFSKWNEFYGFFLIFSVAMIFRFVSLIFISRIHEPEIAITRDSYFTFWEFIRRIRESNFAKFAVFIALVNFTTSMAGPFFAPYMLRDLKFSYMTYTMVIVTGSISTLLMLTYWGRHADKVGNIKVLRVTSLFIPIVPALWIFVRNPVYLMLIQVFAGYVWSGFNLCAGNFIFDAVSPPKRTRCIGYFNALNGVSVFIGAMTGGVLATHLPSLFGYRALTLFLLSGILRGVVVAVMLPMIKEVRAVEDVDGKQFFLNVTGIRFVTDFTREIIEFIRKT